MLHELVPELNGRMCTVVVPELLDIYLQARHHGLLPDVWQAPPDCPRGCGIWDLQPAARAVTVRPGYRRDRGIKPPKHRAIEERWRDDHRSSQPPQAKPKSPQLPPLPVVRRPAKRARWDKRKKPYGSVRFRFRPVPVPNF